MLFFMVVLPGVEPRSFPYKETALTVELQDYMARQEGFEPSVQISLNDGLANRWFKPLTHCRIFYFLNLYYIYIITYIF